MKSFESEKTMVVRNRFEFCSNNCNVNILIVLINDQTFKLLTLRRFSECKT